MNTTENIDKFTLKRVSVFKEEYLLIIFCILLYIQLDSYINLSKSNDPSIVSNSIIYAVLFIFLACLYFPKKINQKQMIIFFVSAAIFRLRALFYLPVLFCN